MPQMRRQRATPDLRGWNSVQRLGLVRNGLRRQRFLSSIERRRRRLVEIRQVRKIRKAGEIGKQIKRNQVVGKILDRKILVKERQKIRPPAAPARSKFQLLQIRPELSPELRILQRNLHSRFQKSQLVAGVVCLAVVDPSV